MIKLFEEFILESKNYPIYKGVDDLYEILKSNTLKSSGEFDSQMRINIGVKDGIGISVTRTFTFARYYGGAVIEFDTQKLSDNYKIIPFSENPDYYLWYSGDEWGHSIKGKSPKLNDKVDKALRNKKYGKQYWDLKTNKDASDHDISEELIVTKEIPNIIKYIKKIYLTSHDKSSEDILWKLSIPYELIGHKSTISDLKNKIKKPLYSKQF